MKTPAMYLYKKIENDRIFSLMKEIAYDTMDLESIQEDISEVIAHILEVSEKMGFKNNLWQDYVAYIMVNSENAFSISCERRGLVEGSINRAAIHDFEIFMKIFSTDLYIFDYKYNTNLSLLTNFMNNNEEEKYFNKRIRNSILELANRLNEAKEIHQLLLPH